jgi:hypothetical protein
MLVSVLIAVHDHARPVGLGLSLACVGYWALAIRASLKHERDGAPWWYVIGLLALGATVLITSM